MRVLFGLPFPPRRDGPHGGSRLIAETLLRMSARHGIAVVYLRSTKEPDIDEGLRQACDVVRCVWRRGRETSFYGRIRWAAGQCAALLRREPMWVSDWHSADFGTRFCELAHHWRPEIVQLEFHLMGQYCEALSGCSAPRVLIVHEPGSEAARDRVKFHHAIRRAIYQWDLSAWQRYEQKILAQVNAAVVFTERDKQRLAPFAGLTPIYVIPPGTLLCEPSCPAGDQEQAVLFAGSFQHAPNLDAAVRLIGNIFPLVRERVPEAQLYVVGDGLPRSMCSKAGPGVVITGRVPDMRPYLQRAAVVVAPMQLGGGVRVKVIEALSAGKAVVASRRAVEGLNIKDGEHFLSAETDSEFAGRIRELLTEPDLRSSLGRKALRWASSRADWVEPMAAFEALYQDLKMIPKRQPERIAASMPV